MKFTRKLFPAVLFVAFLALFVFTHANAQQKLKPALATYEEVDRYIREGTIAAVKARPETYSMCVLFYADVSVTPVERARACRVFNATSSEFELEFSKEPVGAWDINIPQARGTLFVMKRVSKTCQLAIWPGDNELRFGSGGLAAKHCG